MKDRRAISRRGFTLVELLIVIVVIGILSAMMMLSSTEAVSSAKASNIISNLRNLKTAVLGWYADNIDRVVITRKNGQIDKTEVIDGSGNKVTFTNFINSDEGRKEILKYLNNDTAIELKSKNSSSKSNGDYFLVDLKWKEWYICYQLNDARIKEKLASKAKSIGLSGKSDIGNDNLNAEYSNQQYVCMLVLKLDVY